MDDCIFCKIVSGEAPAKIVYENGSVVAIIPIDEVTKGHTLIIPKKHSENIFDIKENDLKEVVLAAKKVGESLKETHKATGINLLNASGKDAQQSVFHFHMHVVPRHHEDGLDMWIKQGL